MNETCAHNSEEMEKQQFEHNRCMATDMLTLPRKILFERGGGPTPLCKHIWLHQKLLLESMNLTHSMIARCDNHGHSC